MFVSPFLFSLCSVPQNKAIPLFILSLCFLSRPLCSLIRTTSAHFYTLLAVHLGKFLAATSIGESTPRPRVGAWGVAEMFSVKFQGNGGAYRGLRPTPQQFLRQGRRISSRRPDAHFQDDVFISTSLNIFEKSFIRWKSSTARACHTVLADFVGDGFTVNHGGHPVCALRFRRLHGYRFHLDFTPVFSLTIPSLALVQVWQVTPVNQSPFLRLHRILIFLQDGLFGRVWGKAVPGSNGRSISCSCCWRAVSS